MSLPTDVRQDNVSFAPHARRQGETSYLTLVFVLVAGVVSVGAGACRDFSTCGERGVTHTYQGSEQYVGTVDIVADGGSPNTANGVFGSTLRAASVDWDPYLWRSDDGVTCSGTGGGPGESLVVSLGGCALSATATSQTFDTGRGSSGDFISAGAIIEPGQSCTIPISGGGTATVKLDSGNVTWDGPTTMRVVFAGTIIDWAGSAPSGGSLTYTFDGSL